MTENQRYVSDVLKTLIRLFHLTGPKCETIEESRFILSNGCCYEVRGLIREALLNKGIKCIENSHCYHSWIEVDGKAFDSLCPDGVEGSVAEYWLINEISPSSDWRIDRAGEDGVSFPIDLCWRYPRLYVAQQAFCKQFGLTLGKTNYKNDKRLLRHLQRRFKKRSAETVAVTTMPIPSPMAYFIDIIEKDLNNGRNILPYPYRLSLKFWQQRVRDLKKRKIPIWQM